MNKGKAKKTADNEVVQTPKKAEREILVRTMLDPYLRHAGLAEDIAPRCMGPAWKDAGHWDYVESIVERGNKVASGDLAEVNHILMAQARTLDTIFTEMARRMVLNMSDHVSASQLYGRLAMKAQSQSRATIEALARMHQPREQTVRHVHVNEGGQAIVADNFHHHAQGGQNAKPAEQPHATGAGTAGSGPAMLGQDTQGNGLSVPGDQGRETLPNARRQGKRRTCG